MNAIICYQYITTTSLARRLEAQLVGGSAAVLLGSVLGFGGFGSDIRVRFGK